MAITIEQRYESLEKTVFGDVLPPPATLPERLARLEVAVLPEKIHPGLGSGSGPQTVEERLAQVEKFAGRLP